MKKIPMVLVIFFGLFCVYGGFHKILFKGGFTVEVLGAWGFGIVLICVGMSELLNRPGDIFLSFVEDKLVLNLYAIASLFFALCCAVFLYISFEWNVTTLLLMIGIVFFGAGVFVILFFDWRDFVRKNYKMEYVDEKKTWVWIMDEQDETE